VPPIRLGRSASPRVQQLLSEVRKLSEDERAELEAELFAEDPDVAGAWGTEIDRRAQRLLGGEARGLNRTEPPARKLLTCSIRRKNR
jgi:hypothetical protein